MCNRKPYWSGMLLALAVLSVAGSAARADVNPVGWWPLDDGAGTAVADVSGNANHGVVTGNAAWTTGKFDGALSFDGTDDYVTLPIGSLLSTLESTTFTLWANWAGSGGDWQRIIDFGSGTSTYAFLSANRGGTSSPRFAIRTASVGEQILTAPATLPTGWHHLAVAMDSATMTMTMYLDGMPVVSGATTLLPKDMGVTTQNWIAKSQYSADAYYKGDVDELRIYNRVLTQDEIKNVMVGGIGYGLASSPSPADVGTFVLPDVTLSWTAGQVAQTHDVYFGDSADAVTAAGATDMTGVLVSSGQAGTTCEIGRLEFGKTYYWRVDEVGPAPDFAVYKGNVWSFTVEPYAYTLGSASIIASASSSKDATMGPEKTIDGSGPDAAGLHGVLETDMWLSSKTGEQPTWIQYEFDRLYKLDEMFVWNSNTESEGFIGYGAKDVTVEYSVDGSTWENLGDFEFVQAPGMEGCAADTTVPFAGAAARFVKLTINSNWGDVLVQFGLSEVRFTYIPVAPTDLTPANEATDVASPVTLSWRPGREAATHEVYLGTDAANLPLAATTTEPTCTLEVDLGNLYFWKVVEVNDAEDPARWESVVQSFDTTAVAKNPGTDNLKHLYTFDDGTASDSVGGADGTLVGGAAVVDGALVTSAQDQWMEMPGSVSEMNTYEEVSIVAWYTPKAGANTGYHMLAYFGDSVGGYGSNGLFFSPARGDNVSRGAISCGNTSAPWSAETGVNGTEYDDGKPHLAVATINAKKIAYYHDGKLCGSAVLSEANKISAISTNFAYLAKGGYTGDPEWIGAIQEFRIYNKALTPGEALYLAGLTVKDPGADNLKHLYTFDDGTTTDSVGGVNGTLVGGATVADGALLTTAQDQWMEMSGTDIAVNTYEAFSVAAWFTPKAGANTGYHMICYFGDSLNGYGSNGIFYTPARGDNVSRAGISCGNVDAPWSAETGGNGPEIDDGNLHFVVVTIDGTSVTLYQDGVLYGPATLSAANKLSAVSTNFAYLAKGGYAGDPEWLGQIHEFRIYNKALTVGEADFLFSQGK